MELDYYNKPPSYIPLPQIPAQNKKIQNYIFNLNELLGRGNFSKVYKAVHELTNQIFAIKVVELNSMKTPALIKLLESEIQILKIIKHPNILNCTQVFSSANNCYIITELCNEGDIESKIREKGPMDEKNARKLIFEVFQGLRYLAQLHIVHRDLKIANIFLKNGIAKIADFGFAKKTNQDFKDINIGSPIYMSPQGLIQNIYGPKTDVWAFGVFLFEITHGDTPLGFCKTESELKFHIVNPIPMQRLNPNLSNELRDLILRCFQIDSRKRISFLQMENHPYIKGLNRQFGKRPLKTLNIEQKQISRQNYHSLTIPQNQINRSNSYHNGNIDLGNQYVSNQNKQNIQMAQSPNKHQNRSNYLLLPSGLANRLSPAVSPSNIENFNQSAKFDIKKNNNASFRVQDKRMQQRRNITIQKNIQPRYVNPNQQIVSRPSNKETLRVEQHLNSLKSVQQNQPQKPRIFEKSKQKIHQNANNNKKIASKPNYKIINSLVSFQQCVQLLHYCRLIYKSVALIQKSDRPTIKKLQDYFATWLLDILDQIQSKISIFVKFQGDKAQIRQKKLREVVNEYHGKYNKELARKSTLQTNIQTLQKITYRTLLYCDSQIQHSASSDRFELIQLANYLWCIHETNNLIIKSIQVKDYSWFMKNSSVQELLNTKSFQQSSYHVIHAKIMAMNE